MLVQSERKPDEPGRMPQWFKTGFAKEQLAKDRPEEYQREHERVIAEALDWLQQKYG